MNNHFTIDHLIKMLVILGTIFFGIIIIGAFVKLFNYEATKKKDSSNIINDEKIILENCNIIMDKFDIINEFDASSTVIILKKKHD